MCPYGISLRGVPDRADDRAADHGVGMAPRDRDGVDAYLVWLRWISVG